MFGYLKPLKAEMKIREYETFRGVYCGLCKQLSRSYGVFASLSLSYDFTCLALVSMSLSEHEPVWKASRCALHPLKKRACVSCGKDLSYAADTAMLLTYYKLRDDLADSHFFGKLYSILLLPYAAWAHKKAAKRLPEIDEAAAQMMTAQASLEKERCASPDKAADPSATFLGKVFSALSDDEKQQIVLQRFGYLLGRCIYFMDALDDLERDRRSGGYNPLLLRFPDASDAEIRAEAASILNLTIGEIAPAYELLERHRHCDILDNLIYLGLHGELRRILQRAEPSGRKEMV